MALFSKKNNNPESVESLGGIVPEGVEPVVTKGSSLSELVGKSVLVTHVKRPNDIKEAFIREISPSGGMVLLKFMESRIPKWDLCENYIIKDILESEERVIPPRH